MKRDDNKAYFEDCKATAQSPKALLVDIEGTPLWVPQSQIDDDSEVWKIDDEARS